MAETLDDNRERRGVLQPRRYQVEVDRSATTEEVAVVRATIECGAVHPKYLSLLDGLDELRVRSECLCGCDSLSFEGPEGGKPIAHACGKDPTGKTVWVDVWGTAEGVNDLELFGGESMRERGSLPDASTLTRVEWHVV